MLDGLKRNAVKVGMKVAKKKPEIMLGLGVTGVVAGVVKVGMSSVKAVDILKERQELLDKIDEAKNFATEAEYSDKDMKNDRITVEVQTGIKLLKLYLPAAGLVLGGLGLIFGSHREMTSRYQNLLAAYNTVDQSYKLLKEQMVNGCTIPVTEDGGVDLTEEQHADMEEAFAYSVVFDPSNPNWNEDGDVNYMFLQNQERYFNDKLVAQGHVFLNEVYEALGFPHTKEGAIVGWVYDTSEGTNAKNHISFDIFDEQWFMGKESEYTSVFIDFNPDGVIYDLI